jgi:hypothetical protein
MLPVDRHIQQDMLDGIASVDDLLRRKNEFFANALQAISTFQYSYADLVTKILFMSEDFYLFRVAVNRSLSLEKKDFTVEEVENWPSVLFAIWNTPDKQMIAVQKRLAAFQKPETMAKIIIDSLTQTLLHRQIRVVLEPLFDQKVFWDIISKHEGRVSAIEFEFVTPNMANISASLADDLKTFAKDTNSTKNRYQIEADKDSSLRIERDNPALVGLVEYSALGGGDIAVRIAKLKKRIHTQKSVKEVEVSELKLQGTPEEIALVLKGIMSS